MVHQAQILAPSRGFSISGGKSSIVTVTGAEGADWIVLPTLNCVAVKTMGVLISKLGLETGIVHCPNSSEALVS